MSCITNLFTDHLSGSPDPGGSWVFNGFGAIYLGAPSDPPGTVTGSNVPSQPDNFTFPNAGLTIPGGHDIAIDWTGAAPGYYYFTYSGGDANCDDFEQIIVQVMDIPPIGIDDITICTDDLAGLNPFNLDTTLTTPDDNGVWTQDSGPVTLTISGGSTITDLDTATAGTYVFTYTITVDPDGGFSLAGGCVNCNVVTGTLTMTVVDSADAGTAVPLSVCNA